MFLKVKVKVSVAICIARMTFFSKFEQSSKKQRHILLASMMLFVSHQFNYFKWNSVFTLSRLDLNFEFKNVIKFYRICDFSSFAEFI